MPPSVNTETSAIIRILASTSDKVINNQQIDEDNDSKHDNYVSSMVSRANIARVSKVINTKGNKLPLDEWLAQPLDNAHHYTPQYEHNVYFQGLSNDNNIDIDTKEDLEHESQVISQLAVSEMSTSQRRLADGIQTFMNTNINSNKETTINLLLDPATVHGHAARLFQEMSDVAMDMDAKTDHNPVAPVISPVMKSAFYQFCRLYTSPSVIAQVPIDLVDS